MFDLTYYNELIEMIKLEKKHEDAYNDVRQRRITSEFNKDKKLEGEIEYMRFRELQEKHTYYFLWYAENFIASNRTRLERYNLVGNVRPLSTRNLMRL